MRAKLSALDKREAAAGGGEGTATDGAAAATDKPAEPVTAAANHQDESRDALDRIELEQTTWEQQLQVRGPGPLSTPTPARSAQQPSSGPPPQMEESFESGLFGGGQQVCGGKYGGGGGGSLCGECELSVKRGKREPARLRRHRVISPPHTHHHSNPYHHPPPPPLLNLLSSTPTPHPYPTPPPPPGPPHTRVIRSLPPRG